jgi:hypothetical protein
MNDYMTNNKKKNKLPQKKDLLEKDPNWISEGDMIFLKKDEIAFPVLGDNWYYNPNIMRLLLAEDPIIYLKQTREGNEWVHYLDVLGLMYIYKGSIRDFEKRQIEIYE